jgi:hypothetical protein
MGFSNFISGKDFGDFLIWRSDGFPSYELAVSSVFLAFLMFLVLDMLIYSILIIPDYALLHVKLMIMNIFYLCLSSLFLSIKFNYEFL